MSAARKPVPDLKALLAEVDQAAYWSENLIVCAGIIYHGIERSPLPAKATLDGDALDFLLEEAKAAAGRARNALDKLAEAMP